MAAKPTPHPETSLPKFSFRLVFPVRRVARRPCEAGGTGPVPLHRWKPRPGVPVALPEVTQLSDLEKPPAYPRGRKCSVPFAGRGEGHARIRMKPTRPLGRARASRKGFLP